MRLPTVKRLFAFAGLAFIGSLYVSAPALAVGRAADAAATLAYLRASEAYAHGTSAAAGASVAAIVARASEIAEKCPSALTYAPRDEAFGEIGEEASTTLLYAGVAPERRTRLDFARAVGRLSWGNRRLARQARYEAGFTATVYATVECPLRTRV